MKPNQHLYFFLLIYLSIFTTSISAQTTTKFSEDYQKWDLDHLLSVINADGLKKEIKGKYIEYYLQRAKKEKSIVHIESAFKNKIWFYKDYTNQTIYADSLLQFALQQSNEKLIGAAYNVKRYIASEQLNIESSLKFSLLAEKYLKETDDLYTLNEIRTFIGTDYYRFGSYRISYLYYYYPANYFKRQSQTITNPEQAYSNFRGYIYCLYGLSKSAVRLTDKKDTIPTILSSWKAAIKQMKPNDQFYEMAYFQLVDGMYLHKIEKIENSNVALHLAVRDLRSNGDYQNEHLAKLFLGKNLWVQNKKFESIKYFTEIDSLYQSKKFINNELAEAYNYLIAYSKETHNKELENYYTNTQLNILKSLQQRHNRMSSMLHENTNIDDLKKSTQIKNQIVYWQLIIGVFILVGVIIIILFCLHKKKKYLIFNKHKQSQTPPTTKQALHSVNLNVILEKLANFEADKGYLQEDLTLDEVARKVRSNRTDVSKMISEYKGGFNTYIYSLRINYIVKCLETDSVLLNQNIESIAQLAGFKNRKTFTKAFKNIKNIEFSQYLHNLRENKIK